MEHDDNIVQQQMNEIYQTLPPEKIPWNIAQPPALLVELIESGRIPPCQAVDLGCGAGNYAVWLASKGFEVTGIDLSPFAIRLAQDLARKKGVECRFLTADLLGGAGELHDSFDFAYDWELLHHIYPEDREKYVHNVRRLLRAGGRYLSVCFSEQDPEFGGTGKYRKTRLNTLLYFSSEAELRALFGQFFRIEELFTAAITGKSGVHQVIYALMRKKKVLQ